MSRSDAERLGDILAAIERCLAYREFLDTSDFGSMAYDAVLRNLAVVGEAVRSLPEDFRADRTEMPWASIAGLRNVVVHEYFRVNPGFDPRHPRSPVGGACQAGQGRTRTDIMTTREAVVSPSPRGTVRTADL